MKFEVKDRRGFAGRKECASQIGLFLNRPAFSLDALGLGSRPVASVTSEPNGRSRLVHAAAWTLGLCAVVAIEENDRLTMLKVGEERARRECAARNPERLRRPRRPR